MKNLEHKCFIIAVILQFGIAINLCANGKTDTLQLDAKQQSLVAISALAGKGDQVLLHVSFNDALNAGWSINELKEAMVHLYAYAGFPRSLNGLNTLRTVVNARKGKGLKDELGKEPSPLPVTKSKLEAGTALQAKLLGRTMKTGTADFAPIIDVFLKEHLFWDIFARDNLDFKTRELITISTLAGLGNAEGQLGAHIGVSMYNGITEAQLHNWVKVIQTKVGSKEGNNALVALQGVLKQGQTNAPSTDTSATKASVTNATVVNKDEANAVKDGKAVNEDRSETIFQKGEKITNDNFIGSAWLQPLIASDSLNPNSVGNVTFEPGARTKWHLHPGGQILLATAGVGYYQEKGGPKRILRKGDVVKCAPNVPHWHGASRDTEFIQIAISSASGGATVWLQPVTDQEYNR